jgi:DNA polymerase III subunit gamma/tau
MTDSPDTYQVLARKYRPTNFDSLIGQNAAVQFLENAIELKKLPHAFILTGIRGVGKTTTARIIAKCFNCTGENDQTKEITANPCSKCSNCDSITKGNHPDVLEIDAASRTGVDDIREIINNACYTSSMGRYKIYIIDEVHMLSNNAFNALLKTLEEPPDHIKFIFATTELRKIPLTILSRCQHLSLKRISSNIMYDFLADICAKENIRFEQNALHLINNYSEGSVRDALSILDHHASLSKNNILEESIKNSFGFGDRVIGFDMISSLLKGEVESVLDSLNKLISQGNIAEDILSDQLDFIYHLHKIKIVSKYNISEIFGSELGSKISELAEQISLENLARLWQLMLNAHTELSKAPNKDQALELFLIRIMHLSRQPSLSKIVANLGNSDSADIKKKSLA